MDFYLPLISSYSAGQCIRFDSVIAKWDIDVFQSLRVRVIPNGYNFVN